MKRSAISSFLHRVRIHGGEFDASARAMHRKAAPGNVPSATIERKIMSTKTTIKRIALVAVAAVGFGMLSGVAANATVTISAGTPTWNVPTNGAYSGTGTAAGTQIVGGVATLTFSETATTTSATSIVSNITSSGVGSIAAAGVSGTGFSLQQLGTTGGAAVYPATALSLVQTVSGPTAGVVTLTATSASAGVQTFSASTINTDGSPGTTYTATITWIAAAAGISAQYSTVTLNTLNTATAATTAITRPNTVGTQAANITVVTKSTNNLALNTETISASITGPGTIGMALTGNTTPSTGRSLSLAETAGTVNISVWPDGTSGTSTITITDGTVTLGTATVTFYGGVTKVVATQELFVAKAGSTLGATPTGALTAASVATTPAVYVAVTDANGTPVHAATMSEVSSSSAAIVAGSCTEVTATSGTYECSVSGAAGAASGASATVTFQALASDGVTEVASAPLTFKIGGAVAKVVLASDAASYTPLSPVKLTATATDSAGNAAYDLDYAFFGGTLTSSIQLGGATLPGTTAATLINGTHAFTGFYAPAAAGDFTVSGVDGTTAANAVSVTATVAGGDSAAAVDAANAATDAANYAADAADAATTAAQEATAAAQAAQDSADAATAAVVALGLRVDTLMASVRAQLTSLSNLLVRIIKKTHA